MSWAVWAGAAGSSRWAKWVDVDAASRWLMVIQGIVQRADNSTLMTDGETARELFTGRDRATEIRLYGAVQPIPEWWQQREAAQTARVIELATAIRGFALACDCDVFALAPYAPSRIACDRGAEEYEGLYAGNGTWREAIWTMLRAQSAAVREASDLLLDLYARVDFDFNGNVAVRSDVIDPDSGRDGEAAYLTEDPNGWKAWTGSIVKTWSPGAGAASSRVEVTVLLPLSYSWALLYGVGRLMVQRLINGTLGLSQGWVAARNARLSRVLGGTGLPSTIVEASAAVEVAALGAGGLPDSVERLMAAVVALVAAANPIAGLVVGIAVGLAELLARVIPIASAHASDCWQRPEPFLQPFAKSGTLAPRAAPTHALEPVPALYRADLPDPNPWAEGLISSDGPSMPPPAPVEEGGGGGGAVVAGLGLVLFLKLVGG